MRDGQIEFTFTAGLLVRRILREMLQGEYFAGREIRWMEDKGWLESRFRVRGNGADVIAIESRVTHYMKVIGETV